MKTTVINGSHPQAAEELIQKAADMPKKLLDKHNIHLSKTTLPQPQLKRARTAGYYESGMALNITHGMQVVDYLLTYGNEYNPSNPAISIASLQAMNTTGQELLDTARANMQIKKEGIYARQGVYGDLNALFTRIINELEASGAPKTTVDNAKHYVKKNRGERIIKLDPNSTANHISASQTSFTEQIQHFTDLINVLTACPEYNPNIEALKLTALIAKRDAMISSNNVVSTAQAVWSTSRIERNQFINAPYTGYVDTYLAVKRAVKAIFGANSAQYHQLGNLTFKRISD